MSNQQNILYFRKMLDDLHQRKQGEKMRAFLREVIVKHMKTSFIFAIAQIEKDFGHLWGQDVPDEQVTEEQWKIYDIYERFRKSVLDNGNQQIRILEQELEQISITPRN